MPRADVVASSGRGPIPSGQVLRGEEFQALKMAEARSRCSASTPIKRRHGGPTGVYEAALPWHVSASVRAS
eukprot:12179075-Alexandrium_andersonii.AAC.1